MHESLFKYIKDRSTTPLRESDVELIKAAFIPKKIRKKQYFLQAGEVCKYIAYIVKGAMRQYRVDDKGMEHSIHFYLESWWAGDRESFSMVVPSSYNIEAWEESDVLAITKSDMEAINRIPALIEMRTTTDLKLFDRLAKKIKPDRRTTLC